MKRRAFQIVALLILGAMVNVAVAWGIAIAPSPQYSGFERQHGPQTFVWTSAFESQIAQSSAMATINWLSAPPRRVNENAYRQLIPRGSAFFNHDPVHDFDTDTIMVNISERVMGWPALSMRCCKTVQYHSRDDIRIEHFALKLPDNWSVGARRSKSRVELPALPLWPGFAINTIFYAAILWVVWFTPGMVRRTLRRRRGLCPACAYPIGSSPFCTECGNPLKIRTCMGLPPPATPATDTERPT